MLGLGSEVGGGEVFPKEFERALPASSLNRLPPPPSFPSLSSILWLVQALAESFHREFDRALSANELLRGNLCRAVDDLNPVRVLQLFSAIPDAVGFLPFLLAGSPPFFPPLFLSSSLCCPVPARCASSSPRSRTRWAFFPPFFPPLFAAPSLGPATHRHHHYKHTTTMTHHPATSLSPTCFVPHSPCPPTAPHPTHPTPMLCMSSCGPPHPIPTPPTTPTQSIPPPPPPHTGLRAAGPGRPPGAPPGHLPAGECPLPPLPATPSPAAPAPRQHSASATHPAPRTQH